MGVVGLGGAWMAGGVRSSLVAGVVGDGAEGSTEAVLQVQKNTGQWKHWPCVIFIESFILPVFSRAWVCRVTTLPGAPGRLGRVDWMALMTFPLLKSDPGADTAPSVLTGQLLGHHFMSPAFVKFYATLILRHFSRN